MLIFEDGAVPVASLYLGERDGDVWIELVEVLPKQQGRGLGAAILEWTVARAQDSQQGVLLQVHKINTDARRLYERQGFVQIAENDTHYFLRHP